MEKRLDASRSGYRDQDLPSHSKKSKKRSSKRSSVLGPWLNNAQGDHGNDMMPGMEYQPVMWPPGITQNFANNGRRLFTAASDPSMCGYTPMPVTYAMEPVSLPPMYRLYPPVPFPGVKTVHSGVRRQCHQTSPMNVGFNSSNMANGFASLQENSTDTPMQGHYQNGEYTSLPPTANKNHGINGDELNAEHRRYSDPGLGSAEAPVHAQSDDSESVDSSGSVTTIGRGNKLVLSLIEQMTELKENYGQMFKELNETKSELETMKVKMTQCKHSSSLDYQPGMLSDLIREIRQANKTCEETLAAEVKVMMEEKITQMSSEMDKLNNQCLKLSKEKEESDRRVAKLEEEVATIKINANNEGREIAAFEEENLTLRRELQEARASRRTETHATKLEKLVETLREKMNGTMDQESLLKALLSREHPETSSPSTSTINKSASSSPPSSSTDEDEDGDDDDDDDDDEEETNGQTSRKHPAKRDKISTGPNDCKIPITLENSANLSGPVTDL